MFMDSRVCWRLLGCGQQQHAGQLLQITHLHIIYRQLTIRVNEAEYSFAQCVDLCFSYWYSRPFYSLRPVEGGIHCLLQHINFAYIIIPRCILHSLFFNFPWPKLFWLQNVSSSRMSPGCWYVWDSEVCGFGDARNNSQSSFLGTSSENVPLQTVKY